MVVLDKKHYLDKAQELLVQPAYRTIERGPINKLKTKLITILRKIKRVTGMEANLYNAMYPTDCTPPNFMACTKSIKQPPPQAYFIKYGISHLQSDKSSCKGT